MTTEDDTSSRVIAYGIGHVGDLWVADRPDDKLALALQVIASELHPAFDALDWMRKDKSKESCILCSLAVRDFLYRIGYRDARVIPVAFWIDAHAQDSDEMIKALGIGNPEGPEHRDNRFDGHVVVRVGDWLIDTTLYQAAPRPEWPKFPTMFATEVLPPDSKVEWFGFKAVAGNGIRQNEVGHRIQWAWLDTPTNTDFLTSPDYKQKWRRERVVDKLVATYRAAAREKSAP